MKILIVNTTLHTGGASIAANRLADALRAAGNEVKFLTKSRSFADGLRFVWERCELLYSNGFDYRRVFAIDHGGCGTDITLLPEFLWADVVHLHWVNQAMLSLNHLERLVIQCKTMGKRLVWTLHDAWPAMGICHLPEDCLNWTMGCGSCRYLRRNALTRLLPRCGRSADDLSARVFRRKQQIYAQGRIAFVACSRYLAERVRRSPLLVGQEVTDIANPLDTDFFSPLPDDGGKAQAALRKRLNLPLGKTILLFVSFNINDPNKAFDVFTRAVNALAMRDAALRATLAVVAVGKYASQHAADFRCTMVPIEYVAERTLMRDLYRAADFFAITSMMENLPNTIVEAKACGLPVVATAVGGIPQMIRPDTDGFLVAPGDADALSATLERAVKHPRRRELGAAARAEAVDTYSQQSVASRYMEVYARR